MEDRADFYRMKNFKLSINFVILLSSSIVV